MNSEQQTRAMHVIINSTKNVAKWRTLELNAHKVRRGDWSIAQWRRHASNVAYSQGPFKNVRRWYAR